MRASTPQACRAAARYADIAWVRATDRASAAAARDGLRASAAAAGRDPDTLTVLAELTADLGGAESGEARPDRSARYTGGPVGLAELIADWHGSGAVDGFHIRPAEPLRDLERLVNGTVALLQHRAGSAASTPVRRCVSIWAGPARPTGRSDRSTRARRPVTVPVRHNPCGRLEHHEY